MLSFLYSDKKVLDGIQELNKLGEKKILSLINDYLYGSDPEELLLKYCLSRMVLEDRKQRISSFDLVDKLEKSKVMEKLKS